MTTLTVAKSVAQIEFQLIEDKNHGIIGRIFIPASLRGKGKVRGVLIYDSNSAHVNCNYGNSRVIEFLGTLAEYERCLKEYAPSNMPYNRMRTTRLINALRKAAAPSNAPSLSVVKTPVQKKQVEVPVAKKTGAQLEAMKTSELRQYAWSLKIKINLAHTRDELLAAIHQKEFATCPSPAPSPAPSTPSERIKASSVEAHPTSPKAKAKKKATSKKTCPPVEQDLVSATKTTTKRRKSSALSVA